MSPTQLEPPPKAVAAPASSSPRPDRRRKRRRAWPQVLKLVRRVHLYLGVALVPWVLMYGATALLFNHSDWLTSARLEELPPQGDGAAASWGLPDPDATATTAFAFLDERARESGVELELDAASVRWLGSVSMSAATETESARLSLDPRGLGGRARWSPRRAGDDEAEPEWFEVERVGDWRPLEEDAEEAVELALRETLEARGVPLESLSVRRYPETRFRFSDGETTYVCDVRMDGEVDVFPESALSSTRNRLLRLHVAHGDPGYDGARRSWAYLVDVNGIAMLLWGLSGLILWWSIRPTRKLGAVALLSGCGAMAAMAVLLWVETGSL